jgi:hypothetical protein
MADPTEVKPSGVAYLLARLKGLWAALYPLYELYQAVNADQTITQAELEEIVQALIVFAGVWIIPNLGYVRRLRDRYGRLVTQGVDSTVTTKLPDSAVEEGQGRHEFTDTDNDGVSDAQELRANDRTQRLTGQHPQEWDKP